MDLRTPGFNNHLHMTIGFYDGPPNKSESHETGRIADWQHPRVLESLLVYY